MSLPEAIEAAGRIIRCYPNGGANAGDGYIGAIAATLASYPKSIAEACADRVKGVSRECKFLPTVADIVAWCEKAVAPRYREFESEKRREEQIAARREPRPAPDNGKKKYTYKEFLEWAKANNSKMRPIGASEPGGYLGSEN